MSRDDALDPDALDTANRSAYASRAAVEWYAGQEGLKPAEAAILEGLGDQIADGRLLDLGIGGGRTTGPLSRLAREYVGIDYVPELVEAARRNHPGVDLRVGDARALDDVADGAFDVAFFSFNGIDGVGHEDRLAILAEVRRVLRPDGAFVFSAHNRGWERFAKLPWQGRSLVSRVVLKQSLAAWRARGNRRRLTPHEVHTDTYAIVNDQAHEWSLLLYYIDPDAQVAQLEDAGFTEVRVHDMHGRPRVASSPEPGSIWLHYLARA